MFIIVIQLFLYSAFLWRSCDPAYSGRAPEIIKRHLMKLDAELVKDSMVKIASVQHLKKMHGEFTAFQIGDLLANLRALMKTMLQTYSRVASWSMPAEQQVESLSDIQRVAFEIHNLIEMAERSEQQDNVTETGLTGAAIFLRMGEHEERDKKSHDDNAGDGAVFGDPHRASTTVTSEGGAHTKRKNKKWHAGQDIVT